MKKKKLGRGPKGPPCLPQELEQGGHRPPAVIVLNKTNTFFNPIFWSLKKIRYQIQKY